MRRFLAEPFEIATKLSVKELRFVRKSCLSIHAARNIRASLGKRRMIGQHEPGKAASAERARAFAPQRR
jgi:hypothetical protein